MNSIEENNIAYSNSLKDILQCKNLTSFILGKGGAKGPMVM